ncbi:MAG: Lrp/AsnC family transcriptional regulator [Firmicutes bacterium]|nr:Lrp/AsnC family transcriptional regulator [Bacillota bacterium]
MGLRAYLLVAVTDDCKDEFFQDLMAEIKNFAEVDFADPVVGAADLVIMVEANNLEAVAEKIAALKGVDKVEILRVTSVLERHRTSKTALLQKLQA